MRFDPNDLPCAEENDGIGTAMQWLARMHRKGWIAACDELIDHWCGEGPEPVAALDERTQQGVMVNVGEWLLARGEIFARGGRRNIVEYLLSRDGPFFTPVQQRWLRQLTERPLALYRVTGVRPREGLTLVDALDEAGGPYAVIERTGSLDARPGMLLGARLMKPERLAADPDAWVFSGAMYPFAMLREAQALADVRRALAGAAGLGLADVNRRDLAERTIAYAWLQQWLQPMPRPQILAPDGATLAAFVDHWQLHDEASMLTRLGHHADVESDNEGGWIWIERLGRDASGAELGGRPLAFVSAPDADARIKIETLSQPAADRARAWFEALAGEAASFVERQIGADDDAIDAIDAPGREPLPPEAMAHAMEQLLRRHYGNWCDEPVPALGNKTPRQAIATPAGLDKVKGLLRLYEDGEARMALEQKRPPFSFQFLWDSLGIAR